MYDNYTWTAFYMEFADKLKFYANNRTELIEKIKSIYDKLNIKIPTLEKDGVIPTDIDPFTVFGLFNKRISSLNRHDIIAVLAQEFGISSKLPEDFNGIPLVNNMQTTFYGFGNDKKADDIENLWKMFLSAIAYADDDSSENKENFCKFFDVVIQQYCVGLASLTMGLFWIRPYTYLSIDSRNQMFLRDEQYMPERIVKLINSKMIKRKNYNRTVSGAAYLEVCSACQEELEHSEFSYRSFPALSEYAWNISKNLDENSYDLSNYSAVEKAAIAALYYAKLPENDKPAQKLEEVIKNLSEILNVSSLLIGTFKYEYDALFMNGRWVSGQGETDISRCTVEEPAFYKIYDEFCDTPLTELKKIVNQIMGKEIQRPEQNQSEWFPSLEEYTPNLSVSDWLRLLENQDIFDENSLFVMRAIYENKGQATCKGLSKKYGKEPQYYSAIAVKLALRIHKETNCPVSERKGGGTRWWSVLFTGKYTGKNQSGSFIWRLRTELKTALKIKFSLSDDKKHKSTEDEANKQLLDTLPSSNSEFLKYFTPLIQALKELGGSATRREAHEKVIELMNISDEELSVTYEKTGASRVLNQIDFARNDLAHEGFISNGTKGVWSLTELGMNIDMTLELAGLIHTKWVKINTAKRKNEPIPDINLSKYYMRKIVHKYTKADFLKEVFITEHEYDKLRSLVLRKKNVILQGAPGVGKTFSAKRLAYSIIGEKNENRICMIQFHQSYSYEDFIMGYRPNENGGFELQSGVFYNFCERCKENPDKPYFFIIDEINRGNLSKIFGELLMLIEADKRGENHKLNLVYGGKAFYIPENLHIIGMMNTADRSLAMIDYALRRRFSFYTMNPAFDNADKNGFGEYMKKIDCELYHTMIGKIKELNHEIRKNSSLGKGFEIGHSYFAPEDSSIIDDEWVCNVAEYEIIPLIEEYWFDDERKTEDWKKILYQALGEEYDS